MPLRTKTIAKKNVSTTKKTGKRCSKASPHCGKEFVFDLPETRCVAEDEHDKFCYCAGCVPSTPAYFDESADGEEEIFPLYHERLRVQEEFLAEQFDDDRPPMSPMSDGSPRSTRTEFSARIRGAPPAHNYHNFS